eukprot:1154868-Pelagomonas_calceolata.AAC.8
MNDLVNACLSCPIFFIQTTLEPTSCMFQFHRCPFCRVSQVQAYKVVSGVPAFQAHPLFRRSHCNSHLGLFDSPQLYYSPYCHVCKDKSLKGLYQKRILKGGCVLRLLVLPAPAEHNGSWMLEYDMDLLFALVIRPYNHFKAGAF